MQQTNLENPSITPVQRRDYAPQPVQPFDMNGVAASDFEFTTEEQEIFFSTGTSNDMSIDHSELLRREIELMTLQSVEEEFEGADDETIPSFTDFFRDIGK